mgnify:CR=1 FL=1
MPKLKSKEKYKKALMKSKKRGDYIYYEDGDMLINKPNVRATRIVHDSDKVTQVRRALRIKNPFKKNIDWGKNNVYTRITKKHYNKEEDKAWKSTYTKIGEKKPGKVKSKYITKEKVAKDYNKTDKKIKKRRTKRN